MDVVLDPFCGGGVTVVEALGTGRRAIGVDTNPLATFVTEMEVADVDLTLLKSEFDSVLDEYREIDRDLFRASCHACGHIGSAKWFEVSSRETCGTCKASFTIASAEKLRPGHWNCPQCASPVRHSVTAATPHELVSVCTECEECKQVEVRAPDPTDTSNSRSLAKRLVREERDGLWLPSSPIPDCNMQRESALHGKGIVAFRQLFSARQLLALASLKRVIVSRSAEMRPWLLFTLSSTLRYCNRMVTRNPGWRGNEPLEWAKPGFWLPPVFLEPGVAEQFGRRGRAILLGKLDQQRVMGGRNVVRSTALDGVVTSPGLSYAMHTGSSTSIPLANSTVDVVITDPPYGSYVHYADLSNFWSAWLPEVPGLGGTIDQTEEAVIARKKFPGAKGPQEYSRLLEGCFAECHRVLKSSGRLILTFHNREPRAWASLLVAASNAGFQVADGGVRFQPGIGAYKHTAQSRRAGSVIGDFIITFRRARRTSRIGKRASTASRASVEKELVATVRRILKSSGPLIPDDLFARLYSEFIPSLARRIGLLRGTGTDSVDSLVAELDQIDMFDSHKRAALERHITFDGGKWRLPGDEAA